jgi:cell division protein ZapA (FtsZ GTPase activity inhibitor)
MTYFHVPPDNVTIQLQGRTFTIKCHKDEKPQLARAVAILENEMQKILQGHLHPSPEQLAVLAALNLAVKIDQSSPISLPRTSYTQQDQARIDAMTEQCHAVLEECNLQDMGVHE